jgi:hypothetical protein
MSNSTKGYYKYINGKQYGPYWYDRGTHHWSVKDFERIFKAVKNNPNNGAGVNNAILIKVLFAFIFELAPYFRNWICIWIKIQKAIAFMVITLGLLKLIAKIISWAKWLETRLAVGWLVKFEKRYAIIVAFVAAIVITLTIIYDLFNFLAGNNTFSESVLDTLEQAICEGDDNGIIGDIVNGATQSLTDKAIDYIMNANENDDDIIEPE